MSADDHEDVNRIKESTDSNENVLDVVSDLCEGPMPTKRQNSNINLDREDGVPRNEDYAFLANALCFNCIKLQTGLMISCGLVILDSIIEMIFGAIFKFSWILWVYSFIILFSGIIGLYGSYFNNAKIIHFFYFCAIGNTMIQSGILIWSGIQYYNKNNNKKNYQTLYIINDISNCYYYCIMDFIFNCNSTL